MRKIILLFLLIPVALHAQNSSDKLIIVTLDGMRWQEIFFGMDEQLARDSNYTRGYNGLKRDFGAIHSEERREKLFPFIWNTIGREGQIFGNRLLQCKMDNANPHWFSYPGYNEIFTGFPDSNVNSNDKIDNPHINVLEYINKQPSYQGKVAVFGSWDVFPYIFNTKRSGLYVNVNTDTLPSGDTVFALLNSLQRLTPKPVGLRPDVLTYMAAKEYLKRYEPGVLYISLDETDDYAHAGQYDQYLKSAHAADKMIQDLWVTVQSHPAYAGKTTLLITTDHGRGDKQKSNWRHHGKAIEDASQIWMAVIGPHILPKGEIRGPIQLYQMQIAATIATFLGFSFTADHFIAPPIREILNQ